jgi:predicted HTH transcriptional regulator
MHTLFDQPREHTPPHNGTQTSIAAAETKARSGSADSDRNRIAVYLHTWPDGATRQQLAEVLGINSDSVRPRIVELIRDGIVVEDGEKRQWNGSQPSKVVKHHTHAKGIK